MSFESFKSAVEHDLNPVDFAGAFFDTAVRQPCNAVRQLGGAKIAPTEHKNDSLAAQAGSMAGFIVDFTILSKITGRAVTPYLGEASGVVGSSAKMFVAGGVYGGVFTPTSENRDLLSARLENALVSGATFAVMGGAGKALEGSAILGTGPLMSRVWSNAISGGAGGVVDAYGRIYFTEHRSANLGEVFDSAGQYAVIGAGFGALDYGLTKGAQKLAEAAPSIQSSYYQARWALREHTKEAKRLSYSVLNKYDMRHPLQRIGDFVYGTEVGADVPKPALTAENNPIKAFEHELPEYFRRIQEKEGLIEQTSDYGVRHDIYEQETGIKADFVEKLLKLWHGTSEQPGIVSHTDAELETPATSAERVGKIRKAFGVEARDGALTNVLAELAGVETPGKHSGYDLIEGISQGKATFFGYDERALTLRMSMPALHHHINRGYSTPVDWMPFEPQENLPNLFHGSVSTSLPSILIERGMLPAAELRLRGIAQTTGECANEEFPRRAISMARSLDEAWAYHRHSPTRLTDYPVIFGISKDVIPKARTAGLLEPGELLTQKLRLGSSLLTDLGLRKSEITHIFVPDGEVAPVNHLLSARRVQGVRVVGFSDIPTPEWSKDPMPRDAQGLVVGVY